MIANASTWSRRVGDIVYAVARRSRPGLNRGDEIASLCRRSQVRSRVATLVLEGLGKSAVAGLASGGNLGLEEVGGILCCGLARGRGVVGGRPPVRRGGGRGLNR